MLRSSIVPTHVSKWIGALLDLRIKRIGPEKNILIAGDLEREFYETLQPLAVQFFTLERILKAYKRLSIAVRDLGSDLNSDSLDGLLVVDADWLEMPPMRKQFWRVLREHAVVLVWTDSVSRPVSQEILADLGCEGEPARLSLASLGYPGNFLLQFTVRKDASPFFLPQK